MKRVNGNRTEIDRFLDSVCGHVRARQLHPEIKDELTAHLEENIEEYIADGLAEEEAVTQAIARMGEPHRIGRELDRTHRPRTDWIMLVLIVLLSGIGLLAMYNIQAHGTGILGNSKLFEQKLVFTLLGAALMCILWSIDYQKIKKYSEYLFVFGLLLMVWAHLFAVQINGQFSRIVIGSLLFSVPTVSLFAMIIGLAGIKPLKDRNWKESLLLIVYRGMLPLFLLMELRVATMAVVYTAIFIVYLIYSRRFWWQVAAFAAGCGLFVSYMAINSPYGIVSRALNFLGPRNDPQGADYMINLAIETMRAAGWWGKGAPPQTMAPYAYSEGLLPNFIYAFGWAGGVAVIMLIAVFIGNTIRTTSWLKDDYGKLLFAGIGCWFIVQFVWAVIMTFGYTPYVGLSLPFISYGGTDQLTQFAAIGLLFSVHRRRNMIAVKPNQPKEITSN